jgi:hypothetical protein
MTSEDLTVKEFSMRLASSAVLGAALFACASALGAECTARVDALAKQVEAMQDPKLKKLAQYDVKRAHRELAEGDEAECTEAADHLEHLIEEDRKG